MRPLILTAAFLTFASLSFSAPSRAQFPPVGGGGTCTGMINEEGYQGQQTAVNNGLYLCSGGTWVEQPLILGTTAAACSATWQGGIRYNGAAIEYCNGSSWTVLGGGSVAISGLTAAAATNTINNAAYAQEWQWNTLAGATALKLSSTSTAAAGNAQKMFEIALFGANATATQTTYGTYISNTHTGATSTNVGLYASASGGTNNYAAIFESGRVGIGTTNPVNNLSVSPVQYSTGTASQSGTTITGVGTTWTTAMVGSQFVFADGTSAGPIRNRNSNTSLTVYTSQTVASQNYRINYTGLQVDSSGNVGIGTASPTNLLTVRKPFNGNAIFFDGQNDATPLNIAADVSDGSGNHSAMIRFIDNVGTYGAHIAFSANQTGFPTTVTQTELMRIQNNGNVGIGTNAPASRFVVAPPASEAVAAAAVITADACGTVKQISSTGNVTTNITNTFTAPTASYAGCCMDVLNIDTTDTITLDANAAFITGTGGDIAVGPGDGVKVCSNGTAWYQGSAVSSLAATVAPETIPINDLTDARTDYVTDHNIFLGHEAPALLAGGQHNTALGRTAGDAITTRDSNTAIGYNALTATNTGQWNVAVGDQTLALNTSGSDNTAVGSYALSANTAGNNTAIGTDSLVTNTIGGYNTSVGSNNLQDNTSGTNNTSVGYNALLSNVTKSESTAIGYAAMEYAHNAAGGAITYNTALGAYALRGSATASANTGTGNTAIGHSALLSNTSGSTNTALGLYALTSNTSGSQNVAIGAHALADLEDGVINIAIGESALQWGVSSSRNVAIGNTAGRSTTGDANTIVGADAFYENTSGNYNVVLGDSAGYGGATTVAHENVLIGYTAGYVITTSDRNVMIGYQAGNSVTTGDNNILIGYDVDTPTATTSNHLNIGNTIYGDLSTGNVGIGTATPDDGVKPHRVGIAGDVNVTTWHDDVGQLQIRGATSSANNFKQLTLGVNTSATPNYAWIQSGENGTSARALLLNPDGGNVGVGTASPQSGLHVPDGKYAQFEDNNAGAPPAGDCDANTERGRMSIDTTNNRLYICNGATRGWDYVALTD